MPPVQHHHHHIDAWVSIATAGTIQMNDPGVLVKTSVRPWREGGCAAYSDEISESSPHQRSAQPMKTPHVTNLHETKDRILFVKNGPLWPVQKVNFWLSDSRDGD
jgi:hypothetical protein